LIHGVWFAHDSLWSAVSFQSKILSGLTQQRTEQFRKFDEIPDRHAFQKRSKAE